MERQDKIQLGNLSIELRRVDRLLRRASSQNPLTREEMTEIRDILNNSAEIVQAIRDKAFQE